MFTKKAFFSFLLFFSLIFLSSHSIADVITLRGGEKYQGMIVKAEPQQLLFQAEDRDGICVFSFHDSKIYSIELEPYEFSKKYVHLRLFPFWLRIDIKIFDELILDKGYSFFGLVEMETPKAAYFSLLTKSGIGIVEFKRDEIVGLERAPCLGRLLARAYFWWRYFLYDLNLWIKNLFLKMNPSTIDNKPIYEWKMELESQELDYSVQGRRIFTPRSLKTFLGGYYSLGVDERCKLFGTKEKYLFLEMKKDLVKSMLGENADIEVAKDKEYWSYPNGFGVIFYKDRLFGYTKCCRKKTINDVYRYFGDKISS